MTETKEDPEAILASMDEWFAARPKNKPMRFTQQALEAFSKYVWQAILNGTGGNEQEAGEMIKIFLLELFPDRQAQSAPEQMSHSERLLLVTGFLLTQPDGLELPSSSPVLTRSWRAREMRHRIHFLFSMGHIQREPARILQSFL